MRSVMTLLSVSFVALFALPAVAQTTDARPAIEAANRKVEAAWAKGDAAAMAALYTSTAVIMPSHAPSVSGAEAVAAFWKSGLASAQPPLKLTTTEVTTHGDTAHETGTWVMTAPDGKVIEKGNYIVIWKKEGGEWKLHRDIWNSDTPAPGA
jgi:uncharacterized protein (TIGR02246 family)